ncbi:hypothetical protein NX784_27540 [Massilia pinisoli]|uniref:Uncharacterized protein n=1 Tax=Massilia pinisoli TaxID=1772194 RepID=A0ABT1ZZK5_9BURK|nr:hypothetical protein [Massilia pinisoli]MCS0585338.1 hypothetical protein [Massilia pinisoli]
MNSPVRFEYPKYLLQTLNQVYDMERKLSLHGDSANLLRNVERIKDAFASQEPPLFYEDPMGQPFSETRTDLEASISGVGADDLVVTEVIKPIIRAGKQEYSVVVQRGIVVVKTRSADNAASAVVPIETSQGTDGTAGPQPDTQNGEQA